MTSGIYNRTEKTKNILRENALKQFINGMPEETRKKISKTKTRVPSRELVSNKELAYILGVLKGDGWITNREIGLAVNDKDFALFFKETLSKWSSFEAKYYIYGKENWVMLHSIYVANFLKLFDINKIKFMDNECKVAFLRGMYDSEGSVNLSKGTYGIFLYNTDVKLLQLCRGLLSDINIESSEIKIDTKIGDIVNFPTKKNYIVTKNGYEIYIGRKENIIKFKDLVGFTIKRKQKRLVDIMNLYPTKDQMLFIYSLSYQKKKNWRKLYAIRNTT